MAKCLTLHHKHNLAEKLKLTYKGSSSPKGNVNEDWECEQKHIFQATYFNLKERSPATTPCLKCRSRTVNYPVQTTYTEHLQRHNAEVVGQWYGYNRTNRFRCLDCISEWSGFGKVITYQKHICPVCFPRKDKRGLKLYRPLLPPNLSAFFATLPTPPVLGWRDRRGHSPLTLTSPHLG